MKRPPAMPAGGLSPSRLCGWALRSPRCSRAGDAVPRYCARSALSLDSLSWTFLSI